MTLKIKAQLGNSLSIRSFVRFRKFRENAWKKVFSFLVWHRFFLFGRNWRHHLTFPFCFYSSSIGSYLSLIFAVLMSCLCSEVPLLTAFFHSQSKWIQIGLDERDERMRGDDTFGKLNINYYFGFTLWVSIVVFIFVSWFDGEFRKITRQNHDFRFYFNE